jgi:transposase
MTDLKQIVILGVDTHKDFHYAALITALGEEVDDRRFDATPAGYRELITWAASRGEIWKAGVECTGPYGAGLTARLRDRKIDVVDVVAPDKQERRLRGKTDQQDAYSAARAVISRRATTVPKERDGHVEAIRVVRVTRQLLVKQSTEATNQLQGLIVSAPEGLRVKLAGLKGLPLARACQKLRDRAADDVVTATMKDTARALGRRFLEQTLEAILIAVQRRHNAIPIAA